MRGLLAYYGSSISGNIIETPEGFLICKNVPIGRTGMQEYLPSEIGVEGEELIPVYRVESEVFDPVAMASFEGKVLTLEHPQDVVEPSNVAAFGKGHLQNVRRGKDRESDLLIADLFVTDPELIRLIKEHKMREVSCGYECEYGQDEQGRFYQRRIRGNHVAVVAAGRAGSRVAIRDAKVPKTKENWRERNKMSKHNKGNSLFGNIFSRWAKDADPEEVAAAVDELMTSNEENKDEEQQGAAVAPAAKAVPAAAGQKDAETDPNATGQQQQDDDPMMKIMEMLQQIVTKINGGNADEDPLAKLEDEIKNEPEAAATDAEGEEAVTVEAEDIPDKTGDEEDPVAAESDKPENPIAGAPTADSRAILAAIGAIKPIIAKLPAGERKAASDAAAKNLRRVMGKDSKAQTNGYVAINRMQRSVNKDAAARKTNDAELGKKIMAKYNPHYKKEVK